MERVVVALPILQQEWSRPRLPRVVATFDKFRMCLRVAYVDSHRFIPTISDWHQSRVQRSAQIGDVLRKWVREVFVLASAKTVPCHDDVTSEITIIRIKTGDGFTLFGDEEIIEHCPAVAVQMVRDARPIERLQASFDS